MQPPDNGKGKSDGVCQTCGKHKGPTISGSITAWIFKDSCCRCEEGDERLTQGDQRQTERDQRPVKGKIDEQEETISLKEEKRKVKKTLPLPAFMAKLEQTLHPPVKIDTQPKEMPIASLAAKRRADVQPGPDSTKEIVNEAVPATAQDSQPKQPQQPLRKFGERYEILETVGEGGMATVYKVRDVVLNQFFAIKVIRPEFAKDQKTRKRFEQESTAARELNHANIVTMYAFDVSPEKIAYIIMDFVDGEDLGKILDRGPLTTPVFYETFIQVCSALAHAHSRGVVHRDIKPSNILTSNISPQTTWVKLVDFGIAKVMNAGEQTQALTKTGDFLGSPTYASPEQAQGEEVDARSDIYSLGCVMFHAITGRPPFTGTGAVKLIMQHCNALPPKIVPLSGDRCSIALERVILRCLEKRPEDRYQNVFDLRTDLQLVQQRKEPQMRESGVPAPMQGELTDFFDHSKDAGNFNTVFDGSLSFDMRIKNVMERILELAIPGDTLLRLESTNPEFEGLIAIRDGVQILGAKILKQNMLGYDALRKMMGLADGRFRYQSIRASDYKLPDLSLQLNLNYILFLYPSLPESPSDLLDQAALHDLVYAVKPEDDDPEMGRDPEDDTTSGVRGGIDVEIEEPEKWVTVKAKTPEKPKSAFATEIEKEIVRFDDVKSKDKSPSAKKVKKGFQRSPIRVAMSLLFFAFIGWCIYSFFMMPVDDLTRLRNSILGTLKPPAKQSPKKQPSKKHAKKSDNRHH